MQSYIPVPGLADRYEILRSALASLRQADHVEIPSYNDACSEVWLNPTPTMRSIWNISQRSQGLSGRYLHDLALTSLTMYAEPGCTLDEAFVVIKRRMSDEDWKGTTEWCELSDE